MMKSRLDHFFETVPVRPMTKCLVENLLLEMPLSPAQTVDFGVDTQAHYRTLQMMVLNALGKATRNDFTLAALRQVMIELDQALGNGPKLNALVKQYMPTYAPSVHFHTSWDKIYGRSDEQAEAT